MWSTVDKVIFVLCMAGIAYPIVLIFLDNIGFFWKLGAANALRIKNKFIKDPQQRRKNSIKSLEILEKLVLELESEKSKQ